MSAKKSKDGEMPLFDGASAQIVDRPSAPMSTGMARLDAILGGGLEPGTLNLVAARLHAGSRAFLLRTTLQALAHEQPVAYFSETMGQPQIRGRLVVLESRVNNYRFVAGLISDEDRLTLEAARERIHWHALFMATQSRVTLEGVAKEIQRYRPRWVMADIACPFEDLTRAQVWYDAWANLAHRTGTTIMLRQVLDDEAIAALRQGETPAIAQTWDCAGHALVLMRPIDAMSLEPTGVYVAKGKGQGIMVAMDFDQRFGGWVEL